MGSPYSSCGLIHCSSGGSNSSIKEADINFQGRSLASLDSLQKAKLLDDIYLLKDRILSITRVEFMV